MKKRVKKLAGNNRRNGRHAGIVGIIAAIVVLAVGTMAAVSLQSDKSKPEAGKVKNFMTSENESHLAKVNGQVVQVNNQTGEFRQLTPEEAQKLADGIKDLVNQSDEGLKQVQHPDGSVSVNLEGRFQNVSVAQKNPDGTISQSCVNSPETAAQFFGIEPEKFEVKTKAGRTTRSQRVPGKGEVK
jgi:hypothetical protein